MFRILLGCAVFLSVAGCSDKSAENDRDGKLSVEDVATKMEDGGAIAMKPGLWETSVNFDVVDATGMPARALEIMKAQMAKGVVTQSCLSADDVQQPKAEFFGSRRDSGCSFDKFDRTGNKMAIAMTCGGPDGMSVINRMNGEFAAENYVMNIEQDIKGMPMGMMNMKGRIKGRYLGDCP